MSCACGSPSLNPNRGLLLGLLWQGGSSFDWAWATREYWPHLLEARLSAPKVLWAPEYLGDDFGSVRLVLDESEVVLGRLGGWDTR